MLISVIMAVYNADVDEFRDCLRSLLSQTYRDFELIIINDGGDEYFFKDIPELTEFHRCKLVHLGRNSGLATALNVGILEAEGEYIARMDADDICLPDRFEAQVSFLEKNPSVDIVGSWAKCFCGSKRTIRTYTSHNKIFLQSLFNSPMVHPSVMGRRAVFMLKYNESLRKAQDYDLWCRAFSSGFKFSNINKVLILYRVRGVSNASKEQVEFAECIRAKHISGIRFLSDIERSSLIVVANRFIAKRKVNSIALLRACFSLSSFFGNRLFVFYLIFLNYAKYSLKRG